MFRIKVHAPDGGHLKKTEYKTIEEAVQTIRDSLNIFNQMDETTFIDSHGFKHEVIQAGSDDALLLFEIMSITWDFTFQDLKNVLETDAIYMLTNKMQKFLEKVTEPEFDTLKEELVAKKFLNLNK